MTSLQQASLVERVLQVVPGGRVALVWQP